MKGLPLLLILWAGTSFAQSPFDGTWTIDGNQSRWKRPESSEYDLILVKGSRNPARIDLREGRWTEPVIEAIGGDYGATRRFACEDSNLAFERKPQ